MFRVSPWIPYDPNADTQHDSRSDNRHRNMNEDVDMDAPQISTLREEETPEPQPNPSRTSKFRVKLVMSEGSKRPGFSAGPSTKKSVARGETDDDEDDEEEDQLIDDDDEVPRAPAPVAVVSAPPPVEKRAAGAKRGTGVGRGRGRGRGAKSRLSRTGACICSKLHLSCVELYSLDGPPVIMAGPSMEGIGTITIPPNSISAPIPSPPKKRGGGPKAGGQRAPRKRAPKYVPFTVVPSASLMLLLELRQLSLPTCGTMEEV